MEADLNKIFNLSNNNVKPQKGKVLISEPFAADSIFRRAVVLLVEYSPEQGALGFILNKFIPFKDIDKEFLKELDNKHIKFSLGGPVSFDKLFYVHTLSSEIIEGSIEIMPGLYWGGKYKQLKEMILSDILSVDDVRFFVGYAGWSPNQLEDELKNNYWLVKDITVDEILNLDEELWTKQIYQLEDKYKIWTQVPENPLLN
jgi:putative transcriptional regulator